MKKILVVSPCATRGDSTGTTGRFLSLLNRMTQFEFQIDLFDTSFYDEEHDASLYPVRKYYKIERNSFSNIIKKIPVVRARYYEQEVTKTFKRIVGSDKYHAVVLFQVPSQADNIIKTAHENGAKVILSPWGSEVLRATGRDLEHIKAAFEEADFMVASEGSNLIKVAIEQFSMPESKIIKKKNDFRGVRKIVEVRGKRARKEMAEIVGLPENSYNILCGYNGYAGQRHKLIIDALSKNSDFLPDNYVVVVPVTYGAEDGYIDELKNYSNEKKLNTIFLTEYMTDEQLAYLHLVTDLLIQIQPTDNGSAFMIESLFAENQIITGRWLKYDRFEQFGLPYYLIDKPEQLSGKLNRIFTKVEPKVCVPHELIKMFMPQPGYDKARMWSDLFMKM